MRNEEGGRRVNDGIVKAAEFCLWLFRSLWAAFLCGIV